MKEIYHAAAILVRELYRLQLKNTPWDEVELLQDAIDAGKASSVARGEEVRNLRRQLAAANNDIAHRDRVIKQFEEIRHQITAERDANLSALSEQLAVQARLQTALDAIIREAARCRNPQSYRDFSRFALQTARDAVRSCDTCKNLPGLLKRGPVHGPCECDTDSSGWTPDDDGQSITSFPWNFRG